MTGPPDPKRVRKFKLGQKVGCKWRNGSTEYYGVIKAIREGRLWIDYDDGSREAITPSLCRADPR